MAWQRYDGKGSKSEYAFPVITVHRSGTIALNGRAMNALERPECVSLLYDESQPDLLGIRAAADGEYTPRETNRGGSWMISAASFLRFLGHAPQETRRYKAVVEADVLAIDLGSPLPKPYSIRKTSVGEEKEVTS